MSSKALATSSGAIFLSETASGYLVVNSTRVKMYQCPPSLGDAISLTMSTATLLNGILISILGPSRIFLTLPVLTVLWHTSQERQNLMISISSHLQ